MNKEDTAKQRLKSSHSEAVWKKGTYWGIMEKVDIAQKRGKSSQIYSAAAWKKET